MLADRLRMASGIKNLDKYTKILLHMDGTDGSTIFKDETGKVWTIAVGAQIDTAKSKFGCASGLFAADGDYISTPDSEDFNLSNGDWTIDFWVRRASGIGIASSIFGQAGGTITDTTVSVMAYFWTNNKIYIHVGTGPTKLNLFSTGAISDTTTWHHIAIVRNGNTVTLYIDGVADATTLDVTGVTVTNSSIAFVIGKYGINSPNSLKGNIDEFRFSKGIARWTANFTPPAKAY